MTSRTCKNLSYITYFNYNKKGYYINKDLLISILKIRTILK